MTPDEKRILELCQRLEELGLNLWVAFGDNPPKVGLKAPSESFSSFYVIGGITHPGCWEELETLCGFIESELDRLGKWHGYYNSLQDVMWGEEKVPKQPPEFPWTRRPTPLEKLQAAVGAMEE